MCTCLPKFCPAGLNPFELEAPVAEESVVEHVKSIVCQQHLVGLRVSGHAVADVALAEGRRAPLGHVHRLVMENEFINGVGDGHHVSRCHFLPAAEVGAPLIQAERLLVVRTRQLRFAQTHQLALVARQPSEIMEVYCLTI